MRITAGLCMCALLLLGAGGGVASAAPSKLRVISPRASSVFTTARAVSIRVAVPSGRARFSASDGSRSLTPRFGSARNGVRTARLVVGRDLRPGSNLIRIRSGRAITGLQIVVATRRLSLVRVHRFLRVRDGAQCLCVRATFRHGLGQPRHPLVGFEAMLNGRIVTNQFWVRRPGQRAALLGANMGLRYGRNTVTVVVFDTGGDYDRATTSIVVPRTLPLASAGFSRRIGLRRQVRLDGTGSIPTRPGGRLRYRWRIVRAPRGSHARLRRANSARPVLMPDVRGNYRVRLTVIGGGGRGAAASAGGAAAAGAAPGNTATAASSSALPTFLPLSNGDPLAQTGGPQPAALPTPPSQLPTSQNSTVVTLTATGPIPPMGWQIQTIYGAGKGVLLNTFPPQAPGGKVQTQGGVQLLLIDRLSLEVEQNLYFQASGATNWQDLSDAVHNANPNQLVVLTGMGLPASFSQSALNSIGYALTQIGADIPGGGLNANMPALRTGDWSVIGRVGLGPGSADEDFIRNDGSTDIGNLTGYLQIDTNGAFVFVRGEYIPFQTRVSNNSANTNTISLGQSTIRSQTLPAGDSGFQVQSFDASTLAVRSGGTFITNTPQGPDNQDIDQMSALLSQLGSNPSLLVVVQSIGKPALSPEWVRKLTPQIRRVGGNWNVFNGLDGRGDGTDGKDGYALVGGAGSDSAPAEQSGPLTGAPGQLSGILAPNHHNRLVVTQDAVSADIVTNLMPLAFSPGEAWPVSGTPGQRAANKYIAKQLFHGQFTDVRDAYWRDTSADFGGTLLDELRHDVSYPTTGTPPFSTQDFSAVQAELLREFQAVGTVRDLVAAWKGIFAINQSSTSVDVGAVADGIKNAIKPHGADSEISFDPMQIVEILTEGVSVGGEVGEVPGLGSFASVYRLASSVASMFTASGDVPVAERIDTTASQLGTRLSESYTNIQKSLDHIGDLLVTNYGKLRTAAIHATSDWALSTTLSDNIGVRLRRATRQLAYEEIMPLVYPTIYDLHPTDLNGSGTSAQNYRCQSSGIGGGIVNPFKYTSPGDAFSPGGSFMGIGGVDGNGNYIVDANVFSGIPNTGWLYDRTGGTATGVAPGSGVPNLTSTPPASVVNPAFTPVSEGGDVGLYPQYFADYFSQRSVACTSTGR